MIGLGNASVAFGSRKIFSDVTFTTPVGRSLAILGPNGRGKTTLLRTVLGLQALDAGRREAPEVAGYVPQHGARQARLPAIEVVTMGRASNLGLFAQPGAQDRAAALEAMDEVGAAHLASRRYDRLSGGQRQLVLIARALATGSPALVLDEPTSALDLGNQSRALALLDALRRRRDRAIIFTTHDPNHALAAADEVMLMMPDADVRIGDVGTMIEPGSLSRLYGVPMAWVQLSGEHGLRRAILPTFIGGCAA